MFEVPASKASIAQNRFDFTWQGASYSIPKLQFIKPTLMKNLRGKDAEILVLGLIDYYYPGSPAQPAVEEIPATADAPAVPARPEVPAVPALSDQFEGLDQLLALYEAWAVASGIKVGESSGSSNSSTSTEEPSTVTSSSPADHSAEETTTEISAPSA